MKTTSELSQDSIWWVKDEDAIVSYTGVATCDEMFKKGTRVEAMFPGMRKVPEWMETAGERMLSMGIATNTVRNTLKAMRKKRRRDEIDAANAEIEHRRHLKLRAKQRGRKQWGL